MHDFYSGEIKAAAKTDLETNENETTRETLELYEDPPERRQELHPDPAHNSDAVWMKHLDTRFGTLSRIFDGKEQAKDADQALIRQYFEHGAPGEYDSRAALLHKEAQALAPHGETLQAQIRKLRL